jgi:ketosteroid isomerase-like protein
MNNLEIIQNGYKAFAEGNIEAVLVNFDPNIEWNECQGFPFIKGEGISIGPEAVVQEVLSQVPVHYEGFNIEVKEMFGCNDKVVMVGFYQGVWKATGKQFRANATHVWTLKDGKATHFFQAVDSATIIN